MGKEAHNGNEKNGHVRAIISGPASCDIPHDLVSYYTPFSSFHNALLPRRSSSITQTQVRRKAETFGRIYGGGYKREASIDGVLESG